MEMHSKFLPLSAIYSTSVPCLTFLVAGLMDRTGTKPIASCLAENSAKP